MAHSVYQETLHTRHLTKISSRRLIRYKIVRSRDTRFHGLKYSSAKQSSATCQNAEKDTKYLVSYQQP